MKLTYLLPAALTALTALLPACSHTHPTVVPKNIDSIVEIAQIHILEDKPQDALHALCDNLTDAEMMSNDIILHTLGKAYYMLIDANRMIDTVYPLDPAYRSNSVTVSEDEKHLIVSYGASGLSRVYALPSMEVEMSAQTPDTLYDAIINQANSRVAIGGAGRAFYVYKFPSGELEYSLSGHRAAVRDLTFLGNDTLLSASADHYVRGWELHNGTETWLLHPHTGGINRARLSLDNSVLITSGDDGMVQLFTLTNGSNPRYQSYSRIAMTRSPVKDAYISPDPDILVGGSTDGSVRFYDFASHEFIGRVELPRPVTGVKIGPDSRIVAAVAYDSFHLMNPIKRQLFCSINLEADSLNSLQFINNNRIMVADPTRVWFIDIPVATELIDSARQILKTL